MTDDNPKALKLWINSDTVKKYFKKSNLSKKRIQNIISKLDTLELKARVQLISCELKSILPDNYPDALNELLEMTKTQDFKSFELWPATEFIQTYGLDHIDESLQAMYHLTTLFTAEFSIRPFINKHGDQIYNKLLRWKNDPNEHVRRWLTEGTRPRLPWGEKLHKAVLNPQKGLEILEYLRFDNSLYVQKSIANHLNDIAKDHPDLVVKTLVKWKKDAPNNYKKEFEFISSRALRVLIKDGHIGALKFMNVESHSNELNCSELKIDKTKVKINETLELSFNVTNQSKKKIKFIIDYIIYFQKLNGKLSPKVFKLKSGFIEAGQKINIKKQHPFKLITTRKYYSGEHQAALKMNGLELKAKKFILKI